MRRRKFNLVLGGGAITLLSGCAGDGIGGNSGAPFDTSFEEGSLIATLNEDSSIDFLQIIGPDGSEVGLPHVIEGAETRKSLMNMVDLSEYNNETLEIVAFDEEENELGSVEVTYAPDLEMLGIETDNQAQEFITNVENTGTGPDSVFATIEIPDKQIEVDPAEIKTSSDPEVDNRSSMLLVRSLVGPLTLRAEDNTLIPGGEQIEVTVPYEFVKNNTQGFGAKEYFYAKRGSIEDVEDIEKDYSLSGELQLSPTAEPVERYNLELTISGLETKLIADKESWGEGDTVTYGIVYTPMEITVGEITRIEE